jgi:hypothetical protein
MRQSLLLTALAVLPWSSACSTPNAANAPLPKVQVFGGHGERAATSQILFGDGIMSGMSITYGQPVWQDAYNGMLDRLKGKLLRLGKDWWTTFTTSCDLAFDDVKVPAGAYLVGLACDVDGNFALTLLEASKGMRQGALPFSTNEQGTMNWQPDLRIPLQLHRDGNSETVSQLRITLSANGDNLRDGKFELAWGKHLLTSSFAAFPTVQR